MIDTTSTADSLVSLIDCITELFHKAGKIDAQNTSYTETTLCYGPRSGSFRIGCRASAGCMQLTHVTVSSHFT